jgi:phenylacetate-CoA ligase
VLPRHDRLLGRDDDMIIFRAVNIYPGQLDELLSRVPGVSSEYNIRLASRSGKDFMTVNVERDPAGAPEGDLALKAEIERQIRGQILVSAEVNVVGYGALPRSEKKSRRIYDEREG